jgi:hypothetical protein
MTAQYDIFRLEENDSVLWIQALPTLEEVNRRLRELLTVGSRYLILDLRTGSRQIVDAANFISVAAQGLSAQASCNILQQQLGAD